jgi:Family of unknown function (DUF6416)
VALHERGETMIDVTVKIEEARLAEFYAMYAEWLKSAPGQERTAAELADWRPEDSREAGFVWANLHPGAKRLFEVLLESPQPVAGVELATVLGPDAREDTVFGSFGPPAKLAKEVGRKHMIRSGQSPEGNAYWLEPTVKTLLEEVRINHHQ